MSFTRPDILSTYAFLFIVVFVLGAFLLGIFRSGLPSELPGAGRRTFLAAAGVLAWLGLVSVPVASGFLEAQPMPRMLLFFAACNLAGVLVALSPLGKQLAMGIPLAALVGFQVFRLPLEIVLHIWSGQGVIPETMTWSGANFDIISGVAALVAAPLAGKFRAAAWIANGIGFLLLLNVGRVAALSSPLPFAWKVDPPLQLVFHLPFAWIVPVCVAGALAGHIILTRALLLSRRRLAS